MQASPIKIAVTSIKPHAGRTTSVLALAWALGRAGYRVVLLDLNQYRDLLPGKSETGSSNLWENVSIGSRETGEPKDVDIVLVDTPPLSAKNAYKILRLVDTVLISAFPIAQNQRFLPDAMAALQEIDPKQVFGWYMSKINQENSFHRELADKLRKEFANFPTTTWIPEDNGLALWNPLAGEEPPEGPMRDAYVELAASLSSFVEKTKKERPAPKAEPSPTEAKTEAKTEEPKAEEPRVEAPTEARATKKTPSAGDSKKTLRIGRERRRARADRRAGRAGSGRRKLDSIPQPFPSKTEKGESAAPHPLAAKPGESGSWRLIGPDAPKFHVVLTPAEARIELPESMRTLPDQVPSSALRALLRFGLVHSLTPEKDLAAENATHLLPKDEATLATSKEEDPLRDACRLMLSGQQDLALSALQRIEDRTDAHYLAGLLCLAEGRAEEAPAHLKRALEGGAQLGSDLSKLGLGVLVNVQLSHGMATHFGANQRGAHFANVLAHLQQSDSKAALNELDCLIGLEPDDMLVHALRAERILDLGSFAELEALHRELLVPSYESPVHVALAFFRAQALHRLGLPDTASIDLRLVHANAPEEWRSLKDAIEVECEAAVETLARIQRVRNDLESAKGSEAQKA